MAEKRERINDICLISFRTAPADLVSLKTKVIAMGLTPEQEYEKLRKKGNLKKQVRDSLMEEQGYICAYCMRAIPDTRVNIDTIPSVSKEDAFDVAKPGQTG